MEVRAINSLLAGRFISGPGRTGGASPADGANPAQAAPAPAYGSPTQGTRPISSDQVQISPQAREAFQAQTGQTGSVQAVQTAQASQTTQDSQATQQAGAVAATASAAATSAPSAPSSVNAARSAYSAQSGGLARGGQPVQDSVSISPEALAAYQASQGLV